MSTPARWLFPHLCLLLGACAGDKPRTDTGAAQGHGEIAADISGPLGTPWPFASGAQRADFARGQEVAAHTFTIAEGLGPAFNVSGCGQCHEKPVLGGGAGLYRRFGIGAVRTEDGAYFPARSAGEAGGVIRLYHRPDPEQPAHPELDPQLSLVGGRVPIPFFGLGLIAELEEQAILEWADPDDDDGDGISGRPNYDRGFVGRFGRKAQTVSIEGFIRGPLMNHMGITTDPLTEEQKAALPVDSSGGGASGAAARQGLDALLQHGQAAADAAPTVDDDGVTDPELAGADLFALVSMAMLMAAPEVRLSLTDDERRGRDHFDDAGCGSCHRPRIDGPRGPLPVYSDLLLHDMGEHLADGIEMGEATGSELRTQPLWGIAAGGPYLHDGRAATLDEAIRWHGGEAAAAAAAYAALSTSDQQALLGFLATLGGAEQASKGLLPPEAEAPAPGTWGGPLPDLSAEDLAAFTAGRAAFDAERGQSAGLGAPRFNGDSCRACHFQGAVGGAGPRGVDVIRHGRLDGGRFVEPAVGTILHRQTALPGAVNPPEPGVVLYELRQTPPLFGLGLIEGIPDHAILAHADPDDADGDGVAGRPSWVDGGRLGRFGWKAQVPSLAEFSRDALSVELGLTLPAVEGRTFGARTDNDDVPDPEVSLDEIDALTDFMRLLGPPPPGVVVDAAAAAQGQSLFEHWGCATCHVPSLPGADGPVPLYSDLLLHEVLPEGATGIEEAGATARAFRTAPLWGVSQSAPYLHDGSADTLAGAIAAHAGEAAPAAGAFSAASPREQSALLAFLGAL